MAIDLTTFTETDPGNYFSVTSTGVRFTNFKDPTPEGGTYVYKDYGVNFWAADFEIKFTFDYDAGSSYPRQLMVCSLANTINVWASCPDLLGVRIADNSAVGDPQPSKLRLAERDGGTGYTVEANLGYDVSDGVAVYCTFWRDESVGTYGTIYLNVYSDSARTNLLHSQSLGLHTSKKDFRYFYATQGWSVGDANPSPTLSGIIQTIYTILVTTNDATNITDVSAQLNGTLDDDSGDTPVMCNFEWGLTTAYGNETLAEAVSESASYSKVIGNNLSAGVTYHFRAKAVGASGDIAYGEDKTFRASVTEATSSNIRVTGLVHHFSAGPQPVYQLELLRGGLGATYIPPVMPKAPEPTFSALENWKPTPRLTLLDFARWESTHTNAQIMAIFGHVPSFNEWLAWMKTQGQ